MKPNVRPPWLYGLLPMLVLGLLSCGLQEYPQGRQNGAVDDPGLGPIDPVQPPTVGSANPTPGTTPNTPTYGPPTPGNPGAGPDPANPTGANPNPAVPPGSGPGVMINGAFVPKEKAIVIIHWGHSNMFGQANSPAELRRFFFDTQPGLWTYRGNGRFAQAREKTATASDGDTNNSAGPGMAILKSLAAAAPAESGYQFISIGRGQSGAYTSQFVKGGLYYSTFMNQAMQLKGKVTFAGMFIMMGITDRHMPLREQGGFADRMTSIVADIRADLGEPNLPVLHTDYEVTSTGTLSINSDFARRIRPLMLSLPERVSNLAIIPCENIPLEDDHHFTFTGHKLWAERGVQIMEQRGWLPWSAGSPVP